MPERGPHWKARLRCLGNAVVPQWSYEVGCRLADIIDPAGEAPTARPTPSVALASAAQATPPRHVGVEAGATLERE